MDEQFLEQFRNESLDQIKSLVPHEVEIFKNEPIEENFTLVLRPDETTLGGIQHVMDGLKKIEPDQFYYPVENLHLTLVGGLPTTIDSNKIIRAVENIISKYSVRFKLKGAGSNKFCSSLSAYPVNFSLHELREELRAAIGNHGDDFSSILQSYEYVGWINFLRFLQPPTQPYFDKLYAERDSSLGSLKPVILQLYKNTSKILDPSIAQLIQEFHL